jgi:hypothetical protein
MSLFFTMVLIAIAWLMSAFINGMAHLWHLTTLLAAIPLWLVGAIAVGLLAWFVSDS